MMVEVGQKKKGYFFR